MKKIISLLFVIGALYLASCNVTDLEPKNAVASTTIPADSSNIELAVAGVYRSAQSQLYGYNGGIGIPNGGDNRGYAFGAAHIDQGEMRGEDLVNTQGFFSIVYQNTQTSSSPNCVNFWSALFEVVNQANSVIDALGTTTAVKPATAAAYVGELRFLRAMAYHEMLIFFARPYGDNPTTNLGVPYRTTPSQRDPEAATAMTRNTVDDCYNKIIADLDFAEANLPDTRDNQVTRATKGAAIALKTRVYQHMNNWAKVIAEAKKIVSSPSSPTSPIGGYQLNADPFDAFKNFTTAESILSSEYSDVDQGSGNGGLGSCFQPTENNGRGLIGVSPNLYNKSFWLAGDSRRSSYIINGSLGAGKFIYYVNKYQDAVTNTDWAPLIRYSEVLLNYSEALARTNDLPNSLLLLNAVRDRAVLPGGGTSYIAFGSQNAQIQAILNERRIEFIGEGRRWPDIHRLSTDPVFVTGGVPGNGIPAKLLYSQISATSYIAGSDIAIAGSVKALPYSNYRFVWPISNTEIANNPNVAQNPGGY